jgi:hypothetical protein
MTKTTWFILIVSSVLVAACGGDDDAQGRTNVAPGDPFGNYDEMQVSVIGGSTVPGADSGGAAPAPGGGTVLVGRPEGDISESEFCISDSLCEVPPVDQSNFCERDGGPVDLIYVDGELVQTICYPPAEDPDRPLEVVDGTTPGDIDIVQNANRTTVVFDPATNGTPIEGDVNVDGNNVAIYGNGPDETILDGRSRAARASRDS